MKERRESQGNCERNESEEKGYELSAVVLARERRISDKMTETRGSEKCDGGTHMRTGGKKGDGEGNKRDCETPRMRNAYESGIVRKKKARGVKNKEV